MPDSGPEQGASGQMMLEGPRGEGWVAFQGGMLLTYLFAPRTGPAWSGALRNMAAVMGTVALLLGGLLLGWSTVRLGRQLTPLPRPREEGQLVISGPYQLVRHPLYTGVLLGAFGLALITRHPLRLLLTVVLALFFDAKTRREELWLTARYPHYAHYRQRISKFIPRVY